MLYMYPFKIEERCKSIKLTKITNLEKGKVVIKHNGGILYVNHSVGGEGPSEIGRIYTQRHSHSHSHLQFGLWRWKR